jgi:hypothetical protein
MGRTKSGRSCWIWNLWGRTEGVGACELVIWIQGLGSSVLSLFEGLGEYEGLLGGVYEENRRGNKGGSLGEGFLGGESGVEGILNSFSIVRGDHSIGALSGSGIKRGEFGPWCHISPGEGWFSP